MRTVHSLKLEAGRRTWEFLTLYPDPSPAGQQAAAGLGPLVRDARRLLQEQLSASDALDRATREREQLTLPLRDALALISNFGTAVALHRRRPDLRVRVRPRPRSPEVFLAEARAVQRLVTAEAELFLYFGMPADLLPKLARDLDRFESAQTRHAVGRATCLRIQAELEAVAEEMYVIIRRLDVINGRRFAGDPGMLELWQRTRAVHPERFEASAPPVTG